MKEGKNIMKIYIVTKITYHKPEKEYEIIGCFSSEAKAKDFIYEESWKDEIAKYRLEEHELV